MKHFKASDGSIVEIYSNVKEMPVKRYNEFQKYLLLEAGIGADMESVNNHLARLNSYISSDMKAESLKEAENLYYNFFSIINKIDFRTMTFACLVAKIGDTICNDFSDDGIERTSELIRSLDLTIDDLERSTDAFKKKMIEDLQLYFPKLFSPEDDYVFYQNLKRQIIIEGNALSSDGELSKESKLALASVKKYFLELNLPQNFRPNDADNVVVQIDRNFGSLCAMIDKHGGTNAQDMSVFDFYSRIDFLTRSTPKKVF